MVNIEGEVGIEFAIDDFLGGLGDGGGARFVEETEFEVGLGGGPFDEAESADEFATEGLAGDGEV